MMPRPMGVVYNDNNEGLSYHISSSMLIAVNEMQSKIDNSNPDVIEICKIVNPCEYVFSSITDNTVTPVLISKIRAQSNFYYELREIINTFNLLRTIYPSVLYIGEGEGETLDNTMKLLFTNASTRVVYSTLVECSDGFGKPFDIIIYNNQYGNLNVNIINVFYSLNIDSPFIMKLSNITNKESIQTLYLLCMSFEKVYLVKPNVTNIMSNDMFIVCIRLLDNWKEYANIDLNKIEIPVVFLFKVEEFNSINGHMQLDAYDQVLNIFHNRNKSSKMDTLKKSNIQKSQVWCDKNNIPYNKVCDKINVFLHA